MTWMASGSAPARAPKNVSHKFPGNKICETASETNNPIPKSKPVLIKSFRKFLPKDIFSPKGEELSELIENIL